ncbi:MAG: serine protease [Bdellovibrionota bacterium]
MKKMCLCLFSLLLVISFKSEALVFEKDQRTDIQNAKNPKVSELAKSVFTFILKTKLAKLKDGSYEFADKTSLGTLVNLCADEQYAENTSVGTRCSGFLAAKNLGITAGHCVSPELIPNFCSDYYIIFDYYPTGKNQPEQLNADSVRECSSLKKVEFSQSASDDYAVLEFSKPVLNRKPLKYRKKGKIKDKENIFMLGYPRGMPQKISEDRVVVNNTNESSFSTNLDCFRGNSGSPVFNEQTHIVEGIFVRGDGFIPNQGSDPLLIGDFYRDEAKKCNRTLVCKKAEGCTATMDAMRTTRIKIP